VDERAGDRAPGSPGADRDDVPDHDRRAAVARARRGAAVGGGALPPVPAVRAPVGARRRPHGHRHDLGPARRARRPGRRRARGTRALMAATRTDVLADAAGAQRYLDAAVTLSTSLTSVTARSASQVLARAIPGFRLRGIDQRLSVWDLFVVWHWAAMQLTTP